MTAFAFRFKNSGRVIRATQTQSWDNQEISFAPGSATLLID
jgi:hypothetical protein